MHFYVHIYIYIYKGHLISEILLEKSKIDSFYRIFSRNANFALTGIDFFCQNYFNLTKIFLLRLFKMPANQIECSKLKQSSVIKFLVAKRCKPCKTYRRICDVYKEAYFNRKNLYKCAKHGFDSMSQSWKDSSLEWKHTHSSGKKMF